MDVSTVFGGRYSYRFFPFTKSSMDIVLKVYFKTRRQKSIYTLRLIKFNMVAHIAFYI